MTLLTSRTSTANDRRRAGIAAIVLRAEERIWIPENEVGLLLLREQIVPFYDDRRQFSDSFMKKIGVNLEKVSWDN